MKSLEERFYILMYRITSPRCLLTLMALIAVALAVMIGLWATIGAVAWMVKS